MLPPSIPRIRRAGPLTQVQCDELRAHVAANLDQTLGPAEMAQVARLPVGQFHRAFKASFDMTPYAYVLDARLRHAGCLLERTNLSLRDVAAASGFFDQAHLGNAFRRRHGVAPSQWRKEHGTDGGPGLGQLPHSPGFEAVTLPPVSVSARE